MRLRTTILLSLCYQTAEAGFLQSPRWSTSVGSVSLLNKFAATVTDLTEIDQTTASTLLEIVPASSLSASRTGEEYKLRLEATLSRLRLKDATSPKVPKEDLQVLFQDEHIIVVNKPSGVLSVKGKSSGSSIAEAVFEAFGNELENSMSVDQLVVHRLGMDTSGLMVMAKTFEAVRGMNTLFRTRSVERNYEALVAGHFELDNGFIDFPLMRDYDCPPFMRVSTEQHQQALLDFQPEIVGKKLLEAPKSCLTKYEVVSRETFEGHPVTRVILTSISGRTHQLNVHLAAFGHPIVGDTTYGINGLAAPNGGLAIHELPENSNRASSELQQALNDSAQGRVCIHAKSLKFLHPVTMEEINLCADSPF